MTKVFYLPRLALLAALAWSGAAQAQYTVPDASVVEALTCMTRRAAPPMLSPGELQRPPKAPSILRLKLVFEQPDRAPQVELLASTSSEQTRDEVLAYAASYRLPCMKPADGAITAVQEFVFDGLAPAEGKPLRPVSAVEAEPSCIVMPAEAPQGAHMGTERKPVHLIIEARFDAGPEQGPRIKIVHSNTSSSDEAVMFNRVARYRMPCRKAGDKAITVEQLFVFAPPGFEPAKFPASPHSLNQFLALARDSSRQPAYFDLNSMACPFQVEWTFMQPVRPNRARQVGKPDLNRTELVAWLASLQWNISERQSRGWLGLDLLIDVPCGALDLRPAANPG